MSMYMPLKHLHMSLAVLSLLLFLLRYVWMLLGSSLLQRTWVKVLPHVVDTLLLLSAIGLMVVTQFYPHQQPWLALKIVALIGYIFAGTWALKRGRTRAVRVLWGLVALLLFAAILGLAIQKPMFA